MRQGDPMQAGEVENLERLARMLDEGDTGERVMKAEILRELSHFEEAGTLLEKVEDSHFAVAVACIKELADNNDPHVHEIKYE
jgi:hypothetical protein